MEDDGSQVPRGGLALQVAEPVRFEGSPESLHPGRSGQWGGQGAGR